MVSFLIPSYKSYDEVLMRLGVLLCSRLSYEQKLCYYTGSLMPHVDRHLVVCIFHQLHC